MPKLNSKLKITVLGAGSWGTAISQLLAFNNYSVTLWCNSNEVAKNIINQKENHKYLPKVKLSNLIYPVTDINQAIKDSNFIFEAIPVKFLRKVIEKINLKKLNKNIPWISLSKGIETNTNLFSSQIIEDILNPTSISVLSGPSFAIELIKKQPTAVDIASKSKLFASKIQKIINNNFFTSIYKKDVLGVEIGGALKNIITIAVGLIDSLGYKDNTKAYIITKGLKEISILTKKIGGNQTTIYGLSGLGDLVLTSLGSNSKNLKFGQLLGQGKNLNQIKSILPTLPEGINTAKAVYQLANKYKINLPICLSIYEIIYNNASPDILINNLFKS